MNRNDGLSNRDNSFRERNYFNISNNDTTPNRELKGDFKTPFALFIADPKGNIGKSGPGSLTYKKLLLNPDATNAEKQAQLLLFKDLIIGFQASENSNTIFRSNLKTTEPVQGAPRTITFTVMKLPPSSQGTQKDAKEQVLDRQNKENVIPDVNDENNLNSENRLPENMLPENGLEVEEHSLEISEDSFVNDEQFEKLFSLTLHNDIEEETHNKKSLLEKEEEADISAMHHKGTESEATPIQTKNIAAKTRDLAINTILDSVVTKAKEAKQQFIKNEKEKDEIADQRKRKHIESDTKKTEIKKEDLKFSQDNKVVDKQLEANVDFNKAVGDGKNPSNSTKFKLPGS